MSLSRFLPNTRETAEETKRRVWKDHGLLVVDVEKVPATWDVRQTLRQVGERLYGKREGNSDGKIRQASPG